MADKAERERLAKESRKRNERDRNLTSLPPIIDVKRRESCRFDLRLFCETYNPRAFFWDWSDAHLKAIARLEEAIMRSAMYAFAMPRGSGKSTLCRMAALWASSYAHCRFVFIIGATADKAEKTLKAIKSFMSLPTYAADFPEIAEPARCLGNIANRASGQTFNGESTMIAWGKDGITLPTVPPPMNWPKSWPLRDDGKVPTSGVTIAVSGLTGDGIRGTLETTTTGEQIRPDAVLLDDPQSDESAASPSQNVQREQLIADAVLGMAGPDGQLSAFMPCTVIRPGDMVDRILDRKLHPEWRGERTQLLTSMPSDMDAWEDYFDVYRRCHLKEPPDFSEANRYYKAHRKELDAGALASWPARKKAHEVSAIQHAMNLFCDRGRAAFMAGYQNDPVELSNPDAVPTLDASAVAAKVNRVPAGVVPQWATRLTAAIDVQHSLLYYVVTAWDDAFSGAVVAYGSYPDQGRPYFALADAKRTLADVVRGGSKEADVFQGLERLAPLVLGRDWTREDDAPLRVSRCLIDANDGALANTVAMFCRQGPYPSITLPYKGKSSTAAYDYYSKHVKKQGERVGLNWIMPNPKGTQLGRHILADPAWWAVFVHERLRVPVGGRGCLSLYGDDATAHRMLADHVTAKKAVRVENKDTGRQVVQWVNAERRDDHLGDCLVYCAIGASEQGVSLSETQGGKTSPARRPAADPGEAARKRAEFMRARGY